MDAHAKLRTCDNRHDNLYAERCLQMLVAETRQTTFDSHMPLTNNVLLRVWWVMMMMILPVNHLQRLMG